MPNKDMYNNRNGNKINFYAALGRTIIAELIKYRRLAAFSVSTIIMPVLLFIMFALPNIDSKSPHANMLVRHLLAAYGSYSILGVAFYSFGVGIASERGQGWTRILRVSSMRPSIYIIAKLAVSGVFSLVALGALLVVVFLVTPISLSVFEIIKLFTVLLLGSVPFSLIGLSIGYWASSQAALPLANILYLPLSFLSGLLIPVSALPEVIRNIAPFLPTYHYGKLATDSLKNEPISLNSIFILIATSFIFGILAYMGFSRDKGRA